MVRSQTMLAMVLSVVLIAGTAVVFSLSQSQTQALLDDDERVLSENVEDTSDEEELEDDSKEVSSPIDEETPVGLMVTGVKDSIVITVEPVEHADGYAMYESTDGENFSHLQDSDTREIVLTDKGFERPYWYYVTAFDEVEGTLIYSEPSRVESATTAPEGATSTIKTLLEIGLAPMGQTMYIWGGGWNEADDGSGPTTMQLGTAPEWREFASVQDASYDFNNHRYEILKGLDCSGYLGFINYNLFHTKSGEEGYVTWAEYTGPFLTDKGLGTYTTDTAHTSYLPGDVLYNPEHLYIVVGRADDGSVLLMHASPNGVKLSGTPTPSGNDSRSAALAREYMETYYPDYYEKDDNYLMPYSYLNAYSKFQYDRSLIQDPDGFLNLSAEEILVELFEEAS